MGRRSWRLVVLAAVSLLVVTVLAIQQARTGLLFFLPGPEPESVQAIVETGPSGLTVYVALLAADGRQTRSDGQLELVVRDSRGVLYRRADRVGCEDFAQARLAGPEGASWSLVTGLGWLGYDDKLGSPPAGRGQVEVTFTSGRGKTLRGVTTVVFPG